MSDSDFENKSQTRSLAAVLRAGAFAPKPQLTKVLSKFKTKPRWIKAFRDLWSDKTRAFLAVLAMAVGVFGAGAVIDAYGILLREMDRNYQRTVPASAILRVDRADADLVRIVRHRPGIEEAEARGRIRGRIMVGPDEWRDLWLFAIDDFNGIRVDVFTPERGKWPPAEGEILLERVALGMAGAGLGDRLTVSLPGAPRRQLRLVGTVHAPGLPPAWMEGHVYGFITRDTLATLGGSPDLNELKIVVAGKNLDKDRIRDEASRLAAWLGGRGCKVYGIEVPEPGKHPHADQMATLLFLLEAFGLLALALSGILVATIVSALLARQVRQIGVMKAVGASTRQVAHLYLATVGMLGVAGIAVGIPAGVLAGRAYAVFAAAMLNFKIFSGAIPLVSFVLQIAVGLLVPILAASLPVYRGCRITVRQAMGDAGTGRAGFGSGIIDRCLMRFRGLSRPLAISLRNTFRRRGRLLLTVGTLAAGGACFIAAMNVTASINTTVAAKYEAALFDIQVRFNRAYPAGEIERIVRDVPGVSRMECWGGAEAARVYSDGTEGNVFSLTAPPSKTKFLAALPLLQGRWLQAGDTNALVLNQALLAKEPDLKAGDRIVLAIDGRRTSWRIVGVVREMMAQPSAYTSSEILAAATGRAGFARDAVIVAKDRGEASVSALARRLERSLSAASLDVDTTSKLADLRRRIEEHLLILAVFLMLMSALAVAVGALGLTAAMSLNVLERTREIGVLRAIGASAGEILRIVVTEGTLIGVLSWAIATALSWPVSAWISYGFGMIFFDAPLRFVVSPAGIAVWLGLVAFLAAAASFYPARGASRLTVREGLAYE